MSAVPPFVAVEIEGEVATITLNRPEARNALDKATMHQLLEALEQVIDDRTVRVIILTGRGPIFCAGDDIKEAPRMTTDEFRSHVESFQEVTRLILGADQPVIARMQGGAHGGGLEIALACDLCVAVDTATFSYPEAALGWTFTNAMSRILPHLVGDAWAKHLALLGDPIDAQLAHRLGLITTVVPEAELETAVSRIVDRLLASPAQALTRTKELLNSWQHDQLQVICSLETETVVEAHADTYPEKARTSANNGSTVSEVGR